MITAAAPSTLDAVWAALGTVRDPELDESVVELDFVGDVHLDDTGAVEVHLRLPTYFCAPNFAFLMVADAYDAVRVLDGVRETTVLLDDHFASDAINGGVAAQAGFVGTFGDLAAGELDELRRDFLRRAVLAGTDVVRKQLPADAPDLLTVRLGDAPQTPELARLRERRRDLGLPAGDDAPLLIDPATGAAITSDGLALHLGRARLSRVNIEANGSMCRGMLRSRYALPEDTA